MRNQSILAAIWQALPIALLLSRAAALTIAYTAHELGHALAATWLGDDTPKRTGRLTLNPARHINGLGFLLGLFLGIGWSKRTRFDPYKTHLPAPLSALIISLAGPLANAALIVGALSLMDGPGMEPSTPWAGWPSAAEALTVTARFNLGVALINLLPLFPLDGFNLLRYLLPARAITGWEYFSGWTTSAIGVSLTVLLFLPINLYWRLVHPLTAWADRFFLGW
jgi:Zn-dependent protease